MATQLNERIKAHIVTFPYLIQETIEGVTVAFVHDALNDSSHTATFKPIEKEVTANRLDALFKDIEADVIFYRHEHEASQIKGTKHYINVGSSGCTKTNQTHCTIVTFQPNRYAIQTYDLDYNWQQVLEAFESRNVPEKDFITTIFFNA